MLKDNFYTLLDLEQTTEEINAQVRINAEHPIFTGHFPGMPVTPGVMQLEMIKDLLKIALKSEVTMKRMATCKFLAILNPKESRIIHVQLKLQKQEEEMFRVVATLTGNETSYLKATIDYRFLNAPSV